MFFDSAGWAEWDLDRKPLIPDGMPVLIDNDLLFEDSPGALRPAAIVNRWLQYLPAIGARSPLTWAVYARIMRDWIEFLVSCGVGLFDSRAQLRDVLSAYAVHRASGPIESRFEASTWNQHVSVLGSFYRWAVAEDHAAAEPFTYRQGASGFGVVREGRVNQATRRSAHPHVTIKYLEPDFRALFLNALAGVDADGFDDACFGGRELLRNGAMGELVFSTGLRRQEFTYLLAHEIPALPPKPTALPVPFAVPAGVAKGSKVRTTWISYDALAAVHRYIRFDRELRVSESRWAPHIRWGTPLLVSEATSRAGRVDGTWIRWDSLQPRDRMRLVSSSGGSLLLAVTGTGAPFTAWATVFRRTGDRIRANIEPRFPHVNLHRARHTFAMAVLEWLVKGYFQAAANIVQLTDPDAALLLYLSKADPLMVLRDLLGHSTVLVTEKYLRRLDLTRIYRDAYVHSVPATGGDVRRAEAEAELEFGDM